MSHDGSKIVVHKDDGFQLIRGGQTLDYKMTIINREMFWGPANDKFAFWAPEGIGVMDIEQMGSPPGPPKYKVVYQPDTTRFPFGFEWSPWGTDIYVIENYDEYVKGHGTQSGTAIKRIPVSGGTPKEIVKHPRTINFFMPPVSRFENGSGPSQKPYLLVFGAPDGLFLVDRDGKKTDRLTEVPAVGLKNLEWSPGAKDKICLFFQKPEANSKGEMMKGVYLIHVDRRQKNAGDPTIFEQLHDRLDVHTLWFSPKGKYVTWATNDAVYFREPDGAKGSETKIEPKDERGLILDVKGCAWDHTESKLAITAGNRVFYYDVAKKALVPVGQYGKDGKSFVAEPSWREDKIVLTVFTDVAGTGEKRDKKHGGK
jgi:hypothetical protein